MARRTMVTAARVRGLEPLSRRLDVDAAASAHPECCSLCRHGRHVKTYPTSWRSRPACRSVGPSADDPSDLERYRHRSCLAVRPRLRRRAARRVAPPRAVVATRRPAQCWSARACRAARSPQAPCTPAPGGRLAPARYRPFTGCPSATSQPGSEQQLLIDGERTGADVASDYVGVGRLHVGRRPDPAGQDQLAEARGVGLDGRLHPVSEDLTGAGSQHSCGRIRPRCWPSRLRGCGFCPVCRRQSKWHDRAHGGRGAAAGRPPGGH